LQCGAYLRIRQTPGERWDPVERDRIYAEKKRAGFQRILSEGDSWFDYPPHRNTVDWLDASDKYAIKRFEVSGDTVANMASDANLSLLQRAAKKEKPTCILFSGGGNDLFTKISQPADLRWIYLAFRDYSPGASARDHIDAIVWDKKKTEIRHGYVSMIEKLGPLAPIIVHGYDYLVPNGKPVVYDGFRLTGPWILPAMKKRKIVDEDLQRGILREIIDDFNQILESLARTYPLTVLHVDLRKTLEENSEWENEIHATEDGFDRISKQFGDAIEKKVPKLAEKRKGAMLP